MWVLIFRKGMQPKILLTPKAEDQTVKASVLTTHTHTHTHKNNNNNNKKQSRAGTQPVGDGHACLLELYSKQDRNTKTKQINKQRNRFNDQSNCGQGIFQ